jgi:cytochrome b subunit of formate dehydrogenase
MSLYTILRLIHIFSGVFWAGVGLMMAGFVNPSAKAVGPESGKFMQQLARQNRFPLLVEVAALLTILSGFWLYWLVSGGFQVNWITSKTGLFLTIGGVVTIVAYALGYVFQKPAVKRMAALGQEIQAAGGPPSPEQMAEMQAQQKKLAQGGLLSAVLLAIAVVVMALAR